MSFPSKLGVVALLLLIFQNSAVALLLRFVRTRPTGQQPSTPCVVMMQELVKFGASLVWCMWDVAQERRKSLRCGALAVDERELCETAELAALPLQRDSIQSELAAQLRYPAWWKLLFPAFLFSAQNMLLFTAMSNLEPTTFMVLYQSKMFLTAVLMIVVLHRTFGLQKWFALALLVGGIVCTQLKTVESRASESRNESKALGVAAVLVCATCSAVASVYMEKVLKDTSDAFYLSTKNVYLSFFSMIIIGVPSFLRVYSGNDESFVSVLHGIDGVVIVMILNQALGGILVALTLRHADNIWKSFATTLAIVVGGVVSHFLFGFIPSTTFLMGSVLVAAAVVLYSLHERC